MSARDPLSERDVALLRAVVAEHVLDRSGAEIERLVRDVAEAYAETGDADGYGLLGAIALDELERYVGRRPA